MSISPITQSIVIKSSMDDISNENPTQFFRQDWIKVGGLPELLWIRVIVSVATNLTAVADSESLSLSTQRLAYLRHECTDYELVLHAQRENRNWRYERYEEIRAAYDSIISELWDQEIVPFLESRRAANAEKSRRDAEAAAERELDIIAKKLYLLANKEKSQAALRVKDSRLAFSAAQVEEIIRSTHERWNTSAWTGPKIVSTGVLCRKEVMPLRGMTLLHYAVVDAATVGQDFSSTGFKEYTITGGKPESFSAVTLVKNNSLLGRKLSECVHIGTIIMLGDTKLSVVNVGGGELSVPQT